MTRDEVFPSKYYKADDLKGNPIAVTIDRAPYEKLKGLDGKENNKIVLYFKNTDKALPLNTTNFEAVSFATGHDDTDDWPGQRIELYADRTLMGGKMVDCVRVRAAANAARKRAPAPAEEPAPPPAPAPAFALVKDSGESDPGMDDQIPF